MIEDKIEWHAVLREVKSKQNCPYNAPDDDDDDLIN